MADEKTFQSVAHDAGELVRNEISELRDTVSDTVAVGLSTARSVGEQLLKKVRVKTEQMTRKRSRPAPKPARVVRKAAKRVKVTAKRAKKSARKVRRARSRRRSTKAR